MTTITHHPEEAQLIDYASGALAEPLSLLVATHIALCPSCRADVARLESAAGDLLQTQEPDSLPDDFKEALMARLDEPEPAAPQPAPVTPETAFLPEPLRSYAASPVAADRWRRWGKGVRQIGLLEDRPGYSVRLAKIRAGARMPEHSHRGEEFTLVISGGFSDVNGHYLRGDVAGLGTEDVHQPVADEGEDCVCLIVTSAPVRLKGLIGSMINPFLRN